VTSKAKRRRFTAEYKRKILQEADACAESGQVGALLRREGLYSSHLTTWRQARERGELEGLAPKRRGPKAQEPNPLAKELAAERREVARLKAENAKLQIICDVQKNYPRGSSHLLDQKLGRRYRGTRPGRSGRPLFGDGSDPVKKHGPGTAADLALVTPLGDPV
jgi:transposase-like protein